MPALPHVLHQRRAGVPEFAEEPVPPHAPLPVGLAGPKVLATLQQPRVLGVATHAIQGVRGKTRAIRRLVNYVWVLLAVDVVVPLRGAVPQLGHEPVLDEAEQPFKEDRKEQIERRHQEEFTPVHARVLPPKRAQLHVRGAVAALLRRVPLLLRVLPLVGTLQEQMWVRRHVLPHGVELVPSVLHLLT